MNNNCCLSKICCSFSNLLDNKGFRIRLQIFLFIAALLIDYFTKSNIKSFLAEKGDAEYRILPFFNLVSHSNNGIAFGLFSHYNIFALLIINVLALSSLSYLLHIQKRGKNMVAVFAFTPILAGSFGNIIDRVSNGCVFDFLDFHYLAYHFPAFNFADFFISIGAISWLAIDAFYYFNKKSELNN